MSDLPEVRASDAERTAVVDELTRHCGEGRLTLEETEERIAAAWSARTVADLTTLLSDLPRPKKSSSGPPARLYERRSTAAQTLFAVHLRIYLIVNAFLIAVWAVSDSSDFWPIWPILGWGLGLALHRAITPRRSR